jgi:hypothetical protein
MAIRNPYQLKMTNCPKEVVASLLISVCLEREAFGNMLLAFFGVQNDFDSVLL